MNRIACWALVFFTINIADQARSADNGIAALENCFKASRLADAICSNPENPPQLRLDCFHKAQAAQLVCLEHFSSEATGSTPPPDTPGAGSSQAPANPTETAGAPVQAPVQAASTPAATAPPAPSPVAAVAAAPSSPDWTITETTSPVDYSPVVIATMKSSADRKDSPGALSIQCRQRRTEISLSTDGAWRIAPNNKVQVALQMMDKSPWTLSANGKVATNVDHAIDLLQSLSEGTTLMVTVSDGVDHGAVFRLTGLDAVRKKILAACRSTPVTESKASMVKR